MITTAGERGAGWVWGQMARESERINRVFWMLFVWKHADMFTNIFTNIFANVFTCADG